MNFEFTRNSQGFEACQGVEVRRINHEGQPALVCRCRESGDSPGVIKEVHLPNSGQYQLKVSGYANNSRTFVHVTDSAGYPLTSTEEREFLKNKKKTVTSVNFYARTTTIRIGIFMGGDSIAVPDNFFVLYQVKLLPVNPEEDQIGESPSTGLRITRVFETVVELNQEKQDPLRGDQKTPMKIGEYAILKGSSNQVDDLYILSQGGLKYVSRIGSGLPNFFGESLQSIPGKVLPVYSDSKEAQKDLDQNPKKFYEPRSTYEWTNLKDQIQGDIFLYLDDSGYVRWLKHS